MACIDKVIGDKYVLINGDCVEGMAEMPESSVHLSIHSPPFAGLYHYSSSDRDLSNCRSYEEFMTHYSYVMKELLRVTMPGRIAAVHAMDIPGDGANAGGNTIDFPGDIIRLCKDLGWHWSCRYMIWKEPLAVRNRTMAKSLAHRQLVEDSSLCDNAVADQLLIFRKPGKNPIPIAHPIGLSQYIGETEIPHELLKYRNWKGKQTENKLSHWIWRRYASAFWSDIRIGRVLPFKDSKEKDAERHWHPLQLDVIERCVILWSNPGEVVFSCFAGVGSELAGALMNGRKAVGFELKPSYYKQMCENLKSLGEEVARGLVDQQMLFGDPLELTEQEIARFSSL